MSLHQDVPHGLDMLVTIITPEHCFISTCVGVVGIPTSTKPDSGITQTVAVSFIISKDTDSGFWSCFFVTVYIESFPVTIALQGGLWTNQWLSRVTTQWGDAILPISDQRVQGVRLLVEDNKLDLLADLHTETDFREGCAPVGGKFCFLRVKPSLPSVKVKGFFVAPKGGIVVKRLLW